MWTARSNTARRSSLEAWRANASVIDEHRASVLERAAADLDSQLERLARFEDLVDELRGWLSPRRYSSGDALAGPGVPSEGLELLMSGRASAHDAAGTRVRQYEPGRRDLAGRSIRRGSADGERGHSVRDDAADAGLAERRLEEDDERLALRLYRYLLARRLEGEPTDDPRGS